MEKLSAMKPYHSMNVNHIPKQVNMSVLVYNGLGSFPKQEAETLYPYHPRALYIRPYLGRRFPKIGKIIRNHQAVRHINPVSRLI